MGRKQSGTKNITIIDNRKVGIFFFVIAAVIIVVNLFVRFYDIHKSADYKHVDGVVSSIDKQSHYYARKRRYKTTVSVIYSPEGTDMNYFVSNSGFMMQFAKKGDVYRVYYKESNPRDAYIAEKDWLTGRYVHAGRDYNDALIITAVLLLIAIFFFEDGVKTRRKALEEGKPEIPGNTEPQKKIRIGDIVTVTVDRPLGSYHPEHRKMYYPVNYGYIEGTIAADGEAQDAYILGINEPVKEFTGEVIGIVHREDDVETKLVVAPQGSSFTSEQIMSRINFTEKYFKSYVVMKLKDIDVDPEDLVALGFKIREGHCCYFLSMDETPSKETLLKLFDLLTIEQELTFWSFYRYSGSDPGEYVTVSVENGKAVAIRGNHGWSSGYESISIDDLIELIQRNWDKDWDSIKNFVNSIELRRVPFPESRRNWMEHPTGVFVPDYSLRAW